MTKIILERIHKSLLTAIRMYEGGEMDMAINKLRELLDWIEEL